jgi:hypothetical protein
MSILRLDTTCEYTLDYATRIANAWSKSKKSDGTNALWKPEYNTAVRGKHGGWIVTNKFDPRVNKSGKGTYEK